MSNPFILFDLDGTISDPFEGIWRSFNFALDHYGYQVLERKEAARFIGPPLDETFMVITGGADPFHINELVSKYRERFGEIGYSENTLYPGIYEALQDLFNRNIPLGICTSKRQDFAIKILKMFDLHNFFGFVSGGDVGIKKVQQIKELLSLGMTPANTIMVGDRAVDLTSAHLNNIDSAGVLWGYGSKEELAEQSPKYLLEKPADLSSLLN